MNRKFKELVRDATVAVITRPLLRIFPTLANRIYDSLPHSALSFLVRHGFFGKVTHPFPWHVTLANGRRLHLQVNPADSFSVGYAFEYKIHDVGLRRAQEYWIDRLAPRSVYLDIGSNIGVSSIYALSGGRKSWLFEPNPALRPFVERLFASNGFIGARHENVALSNEPGEASFFISQSSFLSSFNPNHAALEGETEEVVVQTRTLDSYLPELRELADEILVKIDVEGHEIPVLQGAIETLRYYHPVVMIELLYSDEARTLAYQFMRNLGYSCHGIVNAPTLTLKPLTDLPAARSFNDINFLFLPDSTPQNDTDQ